MQEEDYGMSKKLISLCIVLALVGTSYGVARIGNWENNANGWIDWGNLKNIGDPCNMPTQHAPGKAGYQYATIGATVGSNSIKVTQTGWGQSLSIKLQNVGMVDQFLANDHLVIDYTVAAGTQGGWNEIYRVSLNAPGYGFHDLQTGTVFHYDFWAGSAQRTNTVVIDYSAALPSITLPPGYVEFIFALNSGGGQPDFYFDNAMLAPEPATIALLGLGGLLLRRRKR